MAYPYFLKAQLALHQDFKIPDLVLRRPSSSQITLALLSLLLLWIHHLSLCRRLRRNSPVALLNFQTCPSDFFQDLHLMHLITDFLKSL